MIKGFLHRWSGTKKVYITVSVQVLTVDTQMGKQRSRNYGNEEIGIKSLSTLTKGGNDETWWKCKKSKLNKRIRTLNMELKR